MIVICVFGCFVFLQCAIIGSQVEQKIVSSLEKNTTLLTFGMSFDTQGPRIRAAELMVRNNDTSKLVQYSASVKLLLDVTGYCSFSDQKQV